MSVTVIRVPGIVAPLVSVTVPKTVPRFCWAWAQRAKQNPIRQSFCRGINMDAPWIAAQAQSEISNIYHLLAPVVKLDSLDAINGGFPLCRVYPVPTNRRFGREWRVGRPGWIRLFPGSC